MNNTDQAFIKAYSKRPATQHSTSHREPSAGEAVHYVAPTSGAQYRVERGHDTPGPHTPDAGASVPQQTASAPGSLARTDLHAASPPANPTAHPPQTNTPTEDSTTEQHTPFDLWSQTDPIVVEMRWYPNLPAESGATGLEPTEAERRNQQAATVAFDEPPLAPPTAPTNEAVITNPAPAASPTPERPPVAAEPTAPVTHTPPAAAPSIAEAPVDAPPQPAPAVSQPTEKHDAAAPASANPPAPFRAVWEVDQFAWDEIIDQIATRLRSELNSVGNQLVRTNREGLRVMAVTGLAPQAGTTTVAIQLALAASAQKLNVAVVDANYESPGLSDALGVDVENGWDDALSSGLPLEEAAIQSINDEITLLPLAPLAGRARRNAKQQLGRLLHELSDLFDLIFIDTGSIDALAAGLERDYPKEQIDAAVVVCESEQIGHTNLGNNIDRIKAAGVEQIGLIENRCPV